MNLPAPTYSGSNLGNLSAELEYRLTGTSLLPPLDTELAGRIPDAPTYVLFIVDGLGDWQLSHPMASPLLQSRVGTLRSPFPSTTIVSLATLFTGMAPAEHGILSHFSNVAELGGIVNMLKWKDRSGNPLPQDPTNFLPGPNLWERLSAAGIEPVTVQPGAFFDTPTTKLLYRGCRFEGVWSSGEVVEATLQLATPGRLVVTYLPQLDISAHGYGQNSSQYQTSLQQVADVWDRLSRNLPDNTTLIGTADHGHIDYQSQGKHAVRTRPKANVYGDPRALSVSMTDEALAKLVDGLQAEVIDNPLPYYGPGKHPKLAERAPDKIVLAHKDQLLIPRYMDDRLVGYHGGLDPREAVVPLLVGSS